jgi:predicted N-acyltransferase
MSAEKRLRVEIVDQLDDASRKAWDALAASRSFYVGTRWLSFQRTLEENGRAFHVCVRSDGLLVAAVAVFVVDRPSSGNYDPRRLFPDAAVIDGVPVTLVGGSRGFLSAPLGGTDEHAFDLLLDAVQRIADEHSGGLAWWLYTTSNDATAIANRSGVVPRLLNGECVIDLVGSGFDDYLQSLPRTRRGRVRRDLREFEAAALTIEDTRLSASYEQCGAMLGQTQRKHGLDVSDTDMKAWLDKLCQASEDTGRVYLCQDTEGLPVGFSLIYTEGRTDYMRAVGFDYDRAPHVGEYFELTCYQPIRAAYARGSTALHLGSGAYHAKVRRGAQVRPLWALPTQPGGWDPTLTQEFNARKVDELLAELPGDNLVWTVDSKGWL